VADVHAQGHLRLLAVAPEGPFTDQEADYQAAIEVSEIGHATSCSAAAVSPGRKT
jgi:hypothetical protein